MNRRTPRGFTLIELMIVIVVIAILAAIAYPSYRKTILKSHRSEGKALLTQLGQQQERYFTRTAPSSYAGSLTGLGYASNTENSENGYYAATISAPAACTAGSVVNCFTVTVTATGGQMDDTDCRTMSINEKGQKTATNSSGGDSTDTCW